MSIIKPTYFRGGELALSDSFDGLLEKEIPVVEEDTLRLMLGDKLYDEYLANPTEEKWVKLVEGHTYEYNGYTTNWKGLDYDRSLLCYFTYAKILRLIDIQIVSNGALKTGSEKGDTVSVNSKMGPAQNKGVDLYGSFVKNKWEHYNQDFQTYTANAYNFIAYGGYTFDDWIFTPIDKINLFGI